MHSCSGLHHSILQYALGEVLPTPVMTGHTHYKLYKLLHLLSGQESETSLPHTTLMLRPSSNEYLYYLPVVFHYNETGL